MLAQTDIDTAKATDLLDLIGKDTRLRKVAGTAGGEYAGPCPFCGGRDRLRVQPERGLWWCRQCSGEHWQDAIAYIERRDNLEFTEAVRSLTNGTVTSTFRPVKTDREVECPAGPPSQEWQDRATAVIAECETALWGDCGAKAREWLAARGLMEDTLRAWHIGYNANPREIAGLYVDRGIVIPCQADGKIWYVKVRRPKGDPKYIQVKGGRAALFGADTLGKHDYAVLTEGEFDALLTWQVLRHATNPEWHDIGVATPGSANVPQGFISTWARYLLPVSRFLVCYDMDSAGEKGANTWGSITARAVRVAVPKIKPADKDLTDFHKSGGRILDLITHEIARDKWHQEQAALMAHSAQVAQKEGCMQERDTLAAQFNAAADKVAVMRHALGDDLTEEEREQQSPEYALELAHCLELIGKYTTVLEGE